MKTRTLLNRLSKFYPKSLAEFYDHPGLQVGKIKEEVHTILLCLDFDEMVLEKMKQEGLVDKVDMIFTHHPFIFGTKKVVFERDPLKEKLYHEMEELDIPIYSYHTNFDAGNDGMNDALVEALELTDVHPLVTLPMARGGKLKEPMEAHEFAKYAIEKLNVPYGELINEGNKTISSVAIIGGGGWSSYKNAQLESYDIYISGDIPHHARRDIVRAKYNYLNVPHEVERIFMKQFKKKLLSFDKSLEIIIVDHEVCPELIYN